MEESQMSPLDNLIAAVKQGDLAVVDAMLALDAGLVNHRDDTGAAPAHYAAFHGHRQIIRRLVEHGADINSRDAIHGATPAGWAIEYIRELGGYLAIELDDLAYAIRNRDTLWVARFLTRYPALRHANGPTGTPFQELARESGDPEIARLFDA
jgi:ankyrin repeat protein